MAGLQVRVFGKLSLQHGDNKVDTFPTRRAEELLGFLFLNRGVRHGREKLIEALWPDVVLNNGRASLSTALWRIRTVFNQLGLPSDEFLVTSREWIRFDPPETMAFDLDEFERFLGEAQRTEDPKECERVLRAAIELYSGVFCEGIYSEWCLMKRELLERSFLRCLGQLMASLMQRRAYEEAATFGQEILQRDPLREEVHRAVMRCYWKIGQRARAVRQFQRCARLLQTELHILPMPETIALYRFIVEERLDEIKVNGRAPLTNGPELHAAYETFIAAADDLNALLNLAEEAWEEPVKA